MEDPLSCLRKYNINKKPHIERNDQIIFGKYVWHKTVKTNYLIQGSGKAGTPKEYYTLESLLFFLKNVRVSHPKYCKKAAEEKITAVRRPDRKALLAYLNGESNSSSSIDKRVPIEKPIIVNSEEQNEEVDTNNPIIVKHEESSEEAVAERITVKQEKLNDEETTTKPIKVKQEVQNEEVCTKKPKLEVCEEAQITEDQLAIRLASPNEELQKLFDETSHLTFAYDARANLSIMQ